jgi:hypothetical protein
MKLARLTKPILQLFSSGSSPGPGARTSFVTKNKQTNKQTNKQKNKKTKKQCSDVTESR